MPFKVLLVALTGILLFHCSEPSNAVEDYTLKIIDQDYDLALSAARADNKLLLIDFYTTWCAPCKQLDKLVFQNDSIQDILKKDFVLLRYDAEIDTVFHLSKKHHVNSYPTAIILNQSGQLLNRKYGFPGNDFSSLSSNVLEFVTQGKELNITEETVSGYSADIDPSIYPDFYSKYVNRTDTKLDSAELNDYLLSSENIFTENYFSSLIYFASKANDSIANRTLNNFGQYVELFGTLDTEILMYYLTSGKFNRAITRKSQVDYDAAVAFAKKGLSKKWTDDILPAFERDYLRAQGKWDVVFSIYEKMKDEGEMGNGYVNHFSWQVYEECPDPDVIKSCLTWMKEVTTQEPTFDYLDTYARLMAKSGDKEATKRIAKLAIEAGKQEGRKTKGLEKLLGEL